MAQIARSSTPTPLPSFPTSHGHGRNSVASVGGGPIEEATPFGAVVTEDHYPFADYDEPRRRQPRQPIKNTAGRVDTPTSTFAFIVAQNQENSEKSKTPQYGTEAFRGLLGRAIQAYEHTAFAISGAASPLGASLSFSL